MGDATDSAGANGRVRHLEASLLFSFFAQKFYLEKSESRWMLCVPCAPLDFPRISLFFVRQLGNLLVDGSIQLSCVREDFSSFVVSAVIFFLLDTRDLFSRKTFSIFMNS